jgi:hypothetical protein
VAAFLARWEGVTGHERANYQLFLNELAALLGLPTPEPAEADASRNAYCFERQVSFRHGDGSHSLGYIDLYRRGGFVLEAKDVKSPEGKRYDDAMLRARTQAEAYARALPAAEGWPRSQLCRRARAQITASCAIRLASDRWRFVDASPDAPSARDEEIDRKLARRATSFSSPKLRTSAAPACSS